MLRGLRSYLREARSQKGMFLLSAIFWIFFIVFLIYPISYTFYRSFFVGGKFTLSMYRLMFSDSTYYGLIINSLKLATITTVLTFLIGFPLAFAMVRYEFPLKGTLQSLMLLPFIVPPFVSAIGMMKILGTYGSLNTLLLRLGIIHEPVNWLGSGFPAIVLMQVLHLYPIMYLNIAAALANIDPTLEEAAQALGASGLRLIRTVVIPLSMPGIFAGASIVFIWSFTDLGTPLMFFYPKLVSVQIFKYSTEFRTNVMAYVLIVVVLLIVTAIFLGMKLVIGRKSYAMMGRGHVAPKVRRISGAKGWLLAGVIIVLLLISVLPHISVALLAFAKVGSWYKSLVPTAFTLDNFRNIRALESTEHTLTSIKNSLYYSLFAMLIDIALGVGIAYYVNRSRLPDRHPIDALTMWPLALPGIIIAFGYLAAFHFPILDAWRNPVPLLIVAYAIRRMPYSVRAISAGMQQVHAAFEEAAQSVGAHPLRAVKDIVLPLIVANVLAAGVLVYAESMIEVSASLILAAKPEQFPMTKTIYVLHTMPQGSDYVASAMGLILMLVIGASMVLSSRIMGRRMGEIFKV